MTEITEDDRNKLAQILDTNRGGERGGYSPHGLQPVTDDSLVLIRRGRWSNDGKFHRFSDGEPACGAESESGYRTCSIEEADDNDKCANCWPEVADTDQR